MCTSVPKIPDPPKPPATPPPPTPMAKSVTNKPLRKRDKQIRRGISALTIRRNRPTLNSGMARGGANIY